ncbi:MAG TPA: trehalose-6-phosphate synthase [Bacteroidales bacterium]|nr:trehalose-6-phosphate synthase [Bacteroidales bacterium]HPM86911.1 trehalose-6-phosphate synthase [Bacteroidales bacterium]HQM68808.1 trehalose-6-phosphate synthase [Bacteroidales bacterium]
MKINLPFMISAILAVALVALAFTIFQISGERERLNNELEERNSLIARELNEIIIATPEVENSKSLIKFSDSLSHYSNFIGMALLTKGKQIFTFNEKIKPFLRFSNDYIEQSIIADSAFGKFIKIGKEEIYQYIKPVKKDRVPDSAMIIYFDAGYIDKILKSILLKNFFRWFIQVFLMLAATVLLIRWGIFKPINSIVNWLRAVRGGNTELLEEKSKIGFLEPLHREIRNIAQDMQEARAVAEEEARLRTMGEAIWTQDRLREEVRKLLPDKTLIVVSNREPYMHIHEGREIKCIVPASGMVTAMEPVLKACGGLWIASGSGDADFETVDKDGKIAVPPGEEKYILKRLRITKEEDEHFYLGFSNEGLWPLCHLTFTRPIFREIDWEYYKKVNQTFADAVLDEIKNLEQPFVLVQDFHFALLPGMIKNARPDVTVAIFWHIPWPNPEAFSICPWQKEILKGMLGSDLIGFHTQYQCNNFLETVNNAIDSRVKWDNFTVKISDRTTLVRSFPISIAFTLKDYDNHKYENTLLPGELLARYNLSAQYMGIGVERIDYTKGIAERFLAIEHFLNNNPEFIGRFTFVQLGAPSRMVIKSYSDTISRVESEAARINQKFKVKDWMPILLLVRHHSHEEIAPFYKAANFCMVTSLHDGMNLVAKEFVASRNNNDGVLILSRFAGASRELKGALKINPYDTVQMSEAIKLALEMPKKTQTHRMQQMRQQIVENNIYLWAARILRTMVSIQS